MKFNQLLAAAEVGFGPELCWLAFLITGSWELSVEVVAGVLDLEGVDHPLSLELAHSTRRLVAAASVAVMSSDLLESARRVAHAAGRDPTELTGPLARMWVRRAAPTRAELEQALLAIDVFPRCALLLTVLEGLSIEDAVLLLNADEGLVQGARSLGLVELTRNIAFGPWRHGLPLCSQN